MAEFFTNAPISEPMNGNQEVHADLDGFGWNNDFGLFIPTDGELSTFILPYNAPIVNQDS